MIDNNIEERKPRKLYSSYPYTDVYSEVCKNLERIRLARARELIRQVRGTVRRDPQYSTAALELKAIEENIESLKS